MEDFLLFSSVVGAVLLALGSVKRSESVQLRIVSRSDITETPRPLSSRSHVVNSAYPLGGAVVAPFARSDNDNARDARTSTMRRLSLTSPIETANESSTEPKRAIIVGVAGGSGSGKTSIATLIAAQLDKRAKGRSIRVTAISCDSYYKGLPPGAVAAEHNWDHPSALDLDLLADDLCRLRRGEDMYLPHYCFTKHKRLADTTRLRGSEIDVLILDGIFVLYSDTVRSACDLTIFTSEDLDVCLARRLKRDVVERGRTVESVLDQWALFVKPGYRQFVEPSLTFADLIIPRARENETAINILARDLERRVRQFSTEVEGGEETER